MLTYTGARNLYGSFTDNASSTNLTFGDTMINEGIRYMLGNLPWPFLEKITNETTVASQQAYKVPGDLYKLENVYIQVGTYKYNPTQVTSFSDWNKINNPAGVESDSVSFFFLYDNEIQFWPTPASADNTITFQYLVDVRDISVADYTAGTIVTATNGSKTVTGSGTSWTAGMVGRYIRITAGSAANLGDGLWYEVASVDSTTQITLVREYSGVSITAGSAAYTMGDCMVIPDKYNLGPVYYAAKEYWLKNGDESKADRYEQKFIELLDVMKADLGTKSTDVVIDDGTYTSIINPNLNKAAVAS